MGTRRAIVGLALGLFLARVAHAASGDDGAAGGDTVRKVRATAYALADDRPIFVVEIDEHWNHDRLRSTSETFRSPAGEVLARRTTEFGEAGYRPASRTEAIATGEETKARPLQAGAEVEHREKRDAPFERVVLEPDEPVVMGAGFARFVRDRWDKLLAGETVSFSMVVPRRLDWYRMRIRRDGTVEREGRELVRFNLEPESMFVRAFAGSFEMHFDAKSRAFAGSVGSIEVPGGGDALVEARLVYDGALPGIAP